MSLAWSGALGLSSSPEGLLLQLLQLRLQLQVSAACGAVDVFDGVRLVESLHQDLVFRQQAALLLLQRCHLQGCNRDEMDHSGRRW